MAQQVFPTKSNLMATKRSLALAEQGYDLMDRKRNILVREMMQLIDRAAGIQDRISAAYAEAYDALQKANIMLGSVGEYAGGVPVETRLAAEHPQRHGRGTAHPLAADDLAFGHLL